MAVQHFSHVGICVSDLKASRRFYRDGLGFREIHRLAVAGPPVETLLELSGAELVALYLERDGVRIELLHYAAPGHVGDAERCPMNRLGFTHLSLRVDELDDTIERISAAGGRVVEESRTGNPKFNAGAIFVLDPDGTRVELVESPGDPTKLPGA